MDSDEQIRQQIDELVQRQHSLRNADGGPDDAQRGELTAIEVELDRLWDLLRQREALRDAGGDPDRAHERSADDVERYQQ